MDSLHKLVELFRQFPGIGPRQARRFVYFLLTKDQSFLDELAELGITLKKEIAPCIRCFRHVPKNVSSLCNICRDKNRDKTMLALVAKDIDLEAIERSSSFNGRYFVLGGTIPMLEKKNQGHVRQSELLVLVESEAKTEGLKEILLGLSANPEGEYTADRIKEALAPLVAKHKLSVTTLGRGLSTGSELEYADSETIKSALKNRAA